MFNFLSNTDKLLLSAKKNCRISLQHFDECFVIRVSEVSQRLAVKVEPGKPLPAVSSHYNVVNRHPQRYIRDRRHRSQSPKPQGQLKPASSRPKTNKLDYRPHGSRKISPDMLVQSALF